MVAAAFQVWGAYEVPLIGDDPPRSAAWRFCDRDYPREEIVSPYPFRTAKEHYNALLEETRRKGGPTVYTRATLPDWNGRYRRRREKTSSWYNGAVLQIPTHLSLLTREYQKPFVQQMYHYSGNNAAQWPGSYCWPEGFMRRLAQRCGGGDISIVMTPDLILDLRQGREDADHADSHRPLVRRERRGAAARARRAAVVRRDDRLLGRRGADHVDLEHPGLDLARRVRVRNKLQSIEIYTPRKDDDGNVVGLKQEIVLYDEEALVDPVRIVHILDKRHELNEGDPFVIMECIPQSFPIDGVTTPSRRGRRSRTACPTYGRPWAEIWERYHEQGMERPRERPERPRRIIRSRCTTSARRTS